jgi:hypothetical protein
LPFNSIFSSNKKIKNSNPCYAVSVFATDPSEIETPNVCDAKIRQKTQSAKFGGEFGLKIG